MVSFFYVYINKWQKYDEKCSLLFLDIYLPCSFVLDKPQHSRVSVWWWVSRVKAWCWDILMLLSVFTACFPRAYIPYDEHVFHECDGDWFKNRSASFQGLRHAVAADPVIKTFTPVIYEQMSFSRGQRSVRGGALSDWPPIPPFPSSAQLIHVFAVLFVFLFFRI